MPIRRPTGMPAFFVVWLGQLISQLGTSMTQFALVIWAWQLTGSATALALVSFFSFGPTVLLSPVAGALVDRWNRKLVMMLSDLGAGLSTVVILLLYLTGTLQIWHLCVAGAFAGAFQAFQFPASAAAVTTLVPKAHYTRANGLMSLAESAGTIAAPILAGILLPVISISGVIAIDVITFVIALLGLAWIHVPQPVRTEAGRRAQGSLWRESVYGFRYILARPSLLGLQLVFLNMNLFATMSMILTSPMILARTGDNTAVLGSVQSAMGIGAVAGGLLLSAWGGPRRRVYGVLGGMFLSAITGPLLFGVGRTLPIWLAAGFCNSLFVPILNGCNQAIWMAKVAPDVQGRVFATRRLIAQITVPAAMLMAGPLADRLLEPAMAPGGALAPLFGGLVGTGAGAGMALMFLFSSALMMAAVMVAFLSPAVRNVEAVLPDHDEPRQAPAHARGS